MGKTTMQQMARELHDGPVQRLAVAMILLGKLPTRRTDGRRTKYGPVLERIREELLAVATGIARLESQLRSEKTMYQKEPHHADDTHKPS